MQMRIPACNFLAYIQASLSQVSSEKHQRMVSFLCATSDHVRLNTKWQEQLKAEKERVRQHFISGDYKKANDNSEYDIIGDAVVTVMDATCYSSNPSTDFKPILPVAAVITSSFPTQRGVADEFTLNREQRAAFMIISSHLDGDKQYHPGILIVSIGAA